MNIIVDASTDKQHRNSLERVVSFKDYIAIGFGVIIGVGWVVYAGQWLISGGVLGALLAFLIGGLLMIPIGKSYAELTAAMPVTGGEVAFSYKAFGRTASFLTAWALSMNYIAVTPFETIAVGAMIESIFPNITTATLFEVGGYRIAWSNVLPGMLAGAWVVWLNWRGAHGMARFQFIVVCALLSCAVIFCGAAFWIGGTGNLQPLFIGEGRWWAVAPASIISVIVVVPFFLAGFDCIPQAAEESGVNMQPRQLGVAILATIVIGTLFYVVIILALGFSVSGDTLAGIVAQKDVMPMAEVFRTSFGIEWLAKLVLITALLGIISTLNGIFMAATRLLFAQGRAGLLPRWFAELHPVYQTPKNAIIFVGSLAILGPFVGKAALGPIVSSSSLVFVSVLSITALAALRLRSIAPDLERPYKVSIFTIWVAVVVGIVLVGLMIVPGSPGQLGSVEFLTVAVWLALGSVFYSYRRRQNDISSDEQRYMLFGEPQQT